MEQRGLRPEQRAVVTGAGSGIGRAIACALAGAGLHVWLVGRNAAKLQRVSAQISTGAAILPADITTAQGVDAVAQAAGSALHVLVHAAGAYLHGKPDHHSVAEQEALSAVNARAPILLTSACLPALRAAAGQVVVINSTAALRPGAENGAYAASKQALKLATDALRQEVNGAGIRVLSVFPGRTDTPMQEAVLAAEGRVARPETLMRPEDVAQMVLAALSVPRTAEVTDIVMRPMRSAQATAADRPADIGVT
jgi:short-subunit dehydrogenase